MGLLLNERYWGNVTNELWNLGITPGEPMTDDQVAKMLAITCKALSDLVADMPALVADLQAMATKASNVEQAVQLSGLAAFDDFRREFERLERPIFLGSGMEPNAAQDLLQTIRDFYDRTLPPDQSFDRMPGRIEIAQRVACAARRSLIASQEERKRARSIRQLVAGIATTSADFAAGAALAAGMVTPVTAPLSAAGLSLASASIGVSIGIGATMIYEGSKEFF